MVGAPRTYGVAASNPCADDVLSRSEDVDDRSVVGEGCALVEDVAGTDGDDSGLTSRRGVCGVGVGVSSSDLEINEISQCPGHSQSESTHHNVNTFFDELHNNQLVGENNS